VAVSFFVKRKQRKNVRMGAQTLKKKRRKKAKNLGFVQVKLDSLWPLRVDISKILVVPGCVGGRETEMRSCPN